MSRRRVALLALFLTTLIPRLSAMEAEEGRLRLVLHQGSGRFSLYFDSVSLFVDRDPRTSGLSLYIDNKIAKLGEGGEFQESAEMDASGLRFNWRSKRLTVSENFSFGIPAGLSSPKGLVIDITLTNNSDRVLNVGLRFLLDTYLGEESYPHFQTDSGREINSELEYPRGDMPASWMSAAGKPEGAIGLQGYLKGNDLTVPDRIVFANWKRLSEAPWGYVTSPARSFSELPYSINDSALCQYYDPEPLAANASRSIRLFLAPFTGPHASVQEAGQELPSLAEAGASPVDALALAGDIKVLNGLLQQLDTRLRSGLSFSEEELRLMNEIVAGIKKRLERYGR